MDPRDLLQQLGLNKYEADAYYTLLAEGPLTGYELGKRSAVPLSRSYEILERLHARGLALQQPGDPPRYAAQDYRRFLAGVRTTFDRTLDALMAALAAIHHPLPGDDFWVLRGRQPILAWLRDSMAAARRSVDLLLPQTYAPALAEALAATVGGGRRIFQPAGPEQPQVVLALVDGQTALAGVLDPPEHCRAVLGGNPGLLAVLRSYFAAPSAAGSPQTIAPVPAPPDTAWVDWEMRKQRRLWRLAAGTRSA